MSSRTSTPASLPRIPQSQAIGFTAVRSAAPHLFPSSGAATTTLQENNTMQHRRVGGSAAADTLSFTTNSRPTTTTAGGLDVYDVFERVKGQCLRLWGEVLHVYPTALTAPVTASFAPSSSDSGKGKQQGNSRHRRIAKKHLAHLKHQQQKENNNNLSSQAGGGAGESSNNNISSIGIESGDNNDVSSPSSQRPIPPLRVSLQYYVDTVFEAHFQVPSLSSAPTYEQLQAIHSEVEWVIRVRDLERGVLEAIEVREALKYELMGICESSMENALAVEMAWREGGVGTMADATATNNQQKGGKVRIGTLLPPQSSTAANNNNHHTKGRLGGGGVHNNTADTLHHQQHQHLPNVGPNSNIIATRDIRGCINLLRRASLDVLVAVDAWRNAINDHQVPTSERQLLQQQHRGGGQPQQASNEDGARLVLASVVDEEDDEMINPAIVFMWRGGSYICRMANDLDFLVQYAVQPLGLQGSRELLVARKREAREQNRRQQREAAAQREARQEAQAQAANNKSPGGRAAALVDRTAAVSPTAVAVVVSEEQQALDEEIDDAIDEEIRQKLPPYQPTQEAMGFFAKSALSSALQAALMHCQIANNPLLNTEFKGFQHASTRYRMQLQKQKRLQQAMLTANGNSGVGVGGRSGTRSGLNTNNGSSSGVIITTAAAHQEREEFEAEESALQPFHAMSVLFRLSPPFQYPTIDELSDARKESESQNARLASSKVTKSRQLMTGYGGGRSSASGAANSGGGGRINSGGSSTVLPPLLPDILKSCTSSVPKDTSDEDKKDIHPQLLTWGSQQILAEFFIVARMYTWLTQMRNNNNNPSIAATTATKKRGGTTGHFPISYDALDSAEVDEDILSDLATIDLSLQIPVVYQAPLPDELPASTDAILDALRQHGNANSDSTDGGASLGGGLTVDSLAATKGMVMVGGKRKRLVDLHANLPKPVSNSGIVFNPEDANIANEMYLVFDPNALSPEQQEDMRNQEAIAASVAAFAAQQMLGASRSGTAPRMSTSQGHPQFLTAPSTSNTNKKPQSKNSMVHMTSADLPSYRHRNTTRIARSAEKQFLMLETDTEKEDFIHVCRIQALWRGKVDRSRSNAMIEQREAAKRIQSIARCRDAIQLKNTLVTEYKAASKIQAMIRGVSTRKEIVMIRLLNHAATSIQKVYKGHAARRRVLMIKYVFHAATLIQKTFRGMIDRRYAQDLKERTYSAAATDIQRLWKGVSQRSGRHVSTVQLVGCMYPDAHKGGAACGACAAKVTPLRVSQLNRKQQ